MLIFELCNDFLSCNKTHLTKCEQEIIENIKSEKNSQSNLLLNRLLARTTSKWNMSQIFNKATETEVGVKSIQEKEDVLKQLEDRSLQIKFLKFGGR